MQGVGEIVAALQKQYPVPAIDPQWVRECHQALLDDGQDPSLDAVHEQYLYSDLTQSTLAPPTSLIPANPHKTILFPRPTLLQVLSMTEIGSSAFQLQTVAEQRKDILSGQTLIRRMDDEEEDGSEEEEKGQKLPVYPRGMLKLELGSRDGSVIKAVEYRRLDGIKLGETGLGAKLQCRNVKALRGILMLEPGNTEVLGCSVDHLEENQPTSFLAGLARRMGKSVPGEEGGGAAVRPNAGAPRPRLPPPMRNAQPVVARAQAQAGSSRSRETQIRLSFSPSKSPERPPPPRTARVAPPLVRNQNETPPLSARRPVRAASSAASARVAGLYQQTQLVNEAMDRPTPTKRSRTSRQPPFHTRDQPSTVISIDDEDDFSMDFDDSFLREVDQVTASAARRNESDNDVDDDEDFGYLDDDDSFIRQVDEAEAAATSQPRASATTGATTSRYFVEDRKTQPSTTTRERRPVYVVDSDGSSGKENNRPTDIVYISD